MAAMVQYLMQFLKDEVANPTPADVIRSVPITAADPPEAEKKAMEMFSTILGAVGYNILDLLTDRVVAKRDMRHEPSA